MGYQSEVKKTHVLVINDDRATQKSLYELLCRNGYIVDTAAHATDALAFLDENPHRVILADIVDAGTELLNIIRKKNHPAPVIILTSYGNIDSAVESIKIGAFDYLVRPVEDDKILSTIEKAASNLMACFKDLSLTKGLPSKDKIFHGLVGNTPQMQTIYSVIGRIANTKATVLLRGESGTGKRLVAHAIHNFDRNRKDKPFVELSCGALPRDIIESELFGHTKGAFTGAIADRKGRFEMADGGTVLLDDIDSFSIDLQVKLLRILQQKEFERVGDHKTMKVDVRIVASTNQNLEKLVTEGKFREDLYYRLNVISINIPPLRKRKEDLPLLVEHFINHYAKENYKKIRDISQAAHRALSDYDWPGNIRELENIIERAVILDIDGGIDKDDLPDVILNGIEIFHNKFNVSRSKKNESLKDALQEPEKIHILKVLQEVGWNKKRAAVKLGVNRTTLYNKLRRYNLISHINK